MKKATMETPAFAGYPQGIAFTYVFAAVDDHYGWFHLSFTSKERFSHVEIKGFMGDAKRLIDQKGSPGLDEWIKAMEARGFKGIPCVAAILSDKLTVLECVPPVKDHE